MPRAEDLLVRDERHVGATRRLRAHPVGESADRDALRRADVEDLAREDVARSIRPLSARIVSARGRSSASASRRRGPRAARPARAAWTKRGITIPYWPLCRGPTVLKRRAIDAVEAALLVVARARGTRPSPSSRRRPSGAASWARRSGARPPRGLLLAVVAVDLGGRGDEHALAELCAVLEDDLRALRCS